MEFMSVVVGTAIGLMAGTALLKVIETNKRIKTLQTFQDELKKDGEALLGLIKKEPEEPKKEETIENAG